MEDQPDKTEFPLDEGLNLPKNMVLHRFDDTYLFVVPEKGMWLTVEEIGAGFVQSLTQGNSLAKAIGDMMDRRHITELDATCQMRSLLRQVAVKEFYEDTVPIESTTEPFDFNLHLYLTQQCNLRCKHCYMDSGNAAPEELGLAQWKDVVDQFVDLGGKTITYSGGEPLMFSGFYELADYVKHRNLDSLLITNGILVQDASIAESLSKLVTNIRISIDGASAEAHERIRGSGTFAKANRAIDLLGKTNVRLETATTIYRENLEDVVENLVGYVTHLYNQGVRLHKVGVSKGMRQGRGRDSIDKVCFESNLRKINRQAYGESWDLRISRPVKSVDCGYAQGLVLSSTGDVSPCAEYFFGGANIKRESLSDIYTRFKADHQRSLVYNIPLCENCDLRFICGGGCRMESMKKNGDVCRPACSPDYRREHYLRLVGRDEVFFRVARIVDRQNRLQGTI